MKKSNSYVLLFGLFFLFFVQMAGTLVESIYILDLMNTALDEKALGVLFFFSPVLLLPFRIKRPDRWTWGAFGLLFLARGLIPYLDTLGRMLASGVGIGAVLLLFPFLIVAQPKDGARPKTALWASTGLAFAVVLSAFLRTLNYGIDSSLTSSGGWIGWGLGLLCGYLLIQLDWPGIPVEQRSKNGLAPAVLGIFLLLALVYFAFSAPAVIARWTESNNALIVIVVSLISAGWAVLALRQPGLVERLSNRWLLLWNLLFTLSLVGTLLVHRVPFPETTESPVVVVGAPTLLQQIPLALMLLLFPVIFLNARIFFRRIQETEPSPRSFIPGMLLGSLVLVLLVFMHIFTNVWGYVEPVSPWFRNKFWLPYLLIAGTVPLLVASVKPLETDAPFGDDTGGRQEKALNGAWAGLLGALSLATALSALWITRVQSFDADTSSLTVMTYNIQQANDDCGERSYERQLALIRQVSPDILALQESDSARVSLNNTDYVAYYAGKLGYYSYYGPKTLTGTYGTALLSKYPLQNTRTIFSYSD